jgi:hypothetical protein
MDIELSVEHNFIEHFTTGGATEVQCRCGRTHTAMLAYHDWDDDHETIDNIVSSIEEQAKEDETMILNWDVDSIDIMQIGSVIFVPECECKGWVPYMEFMVNQRYEIANFLVDVAEEVKRLQSYAEVYDILAEEYER